jgi:hypothetical protein
VGFVGMGVLIRTLEKMLFHSTESGCCDVLRFEEIIWENKMQIDMCFVLVVWLF